MPRKPKPPLQPAPRPEMPLRELQQWLNAQPELQGLVRLEVAGRADHAGGSAGVPAWQVTDLPAWQVADRLAVQHGLRALGPRAWLPLERDASTALATQLLQRDLAYGAPLLAEKAAAWRAAQLVGALHPYSARFVASGTLEPGLARWTPLGRHTFELALAGMDATQAFWLYAGAED